MSIIHKVLLLYKNYERIVVEPRGFSLQLQSSSHEKADASCVDSIILKIGHDLVKVHLPQSSQGLVQCRITVSSPSSWGD